MKKIISILLALFTILSVLTLGSCEINPSDNPEETTENGGSEKKTREKVVLMFEIDEGLGGYEFVAGCKTLTGEYDYDKIDIVLNNIYDGLSKFDTDYYIPAVHIYPTWYYKESGWNTNYTDGLQKWSDDFLYAMNFFQEKGIKVYLEYISSTVYVAQNGEEGSLPCVNINHGTSEEERNVWGVPCDLQSIKALKEHFPDTFVGVRYHELLGTKALAAQGNSHACDILPEDVEYFSEKFADYGLEVIWSDHSFYLMSTQATYAFWVDTINHVREKLGDKFTLMVANNTNPIDAITFKVYDQMVEKFEGVNMGLSNQAWWLDNFILNDTKCNSYYAIPVEILAGFTQKAIDRGAKVVQFEPYFDLFNYTRQSINGKKDYAAGGIAMNKVTPRYEEIQSDSLDYSPRLELYRLAEYLNAETFEFTNVETFFDTSEAKVLKDSADNPPVMFEQTSLCFVSDSVEVFDKYNYDATKWLSQDNYRFTSKVDLTNAIYAGRTSFCAGAFDDFIVVNKVDGQNVGTLFNCISSKVLTDTTTFADNDDGEFIGFASANLIQEKTSRSKDADELVVFRKKGDKINLSLYQSNSAGTGYLRIYGSAASILLDYFGGYTLDAENFVGVYGIRNNKVVGKTSYLRSIDGLIAVYADGNTITLTGKKSISSAEINQTIQINGTFVGCTFADTTMDINSADELVVVYKSEGTNYFECYEFKSATSLSATGERVQLKGKDIKLVFNFERFIYQNSGN